MHTQARSMAQLGIDTQPVPAEQLLPLQRAARAQMAAGLWFPNSAHVIDPLEAVRAFAAAAVARGSNALSPLPAEFSPLTEPASLFDPARFTESR